MRNKIRKEKSIWIIESLIIVVPLTLLSIWLSPLDMDACIWDLCDRFITFFAGYQFVCFISNKVRISARKDSLIAYARILEESILALDENSSQLKSTTLSRIKGFQAQSTMLHEDVAEKIKAVSDAIEASVPAESEQLKECCIFMKYELIEVRHEIEELNLSWNQSWLLRLFK